MLLLHYGLNVLVVTLGHTVYLYLRVTRLVRMLCLHSCVAQVGDVAQAQDALDKSICKMIRSVFHNLMPDLVGSDRLFECRCR